MLRQITAAVIAIWISAVASAAQSETVIKLGYILAPDSQLGSGAKVFGDEVAKRTQGRYRVEQYPNAQLGGEVEMMKGVQLGTIDAAFVTGAPVPNFVPEVGVFNIPFLIPDAAHAHTLLDGAFGRDLLKEFEPKGLMALAWGENGMRHLTNSKHSIDTPGNLIGLKLRVPQSDIMVTGFRALGADVHQLAFPELYSALQVGAFDAQENPIATIVASKFYQVQRFLTLSGHIYDPAVFVISQDLFGEMSAADRAAFTEAARLGGLASREYAAQAEKTGIAFLEQNGMTVVASIDKTAFVAAMAPVMPVFESKFGAATIAMLRGQKIAGN